MPTRDETTVHEHSGGRHTARHITEPRILLRLRVSRDSGRTWGQVTEVREDENLPLLDNPGALPPCACLRCTPRTPRPEDSPAGLS